MSSGQTAPDKIASYIIAVSLKFPQYFLREKVTKYTRSFGISLGFCRTVLKLLPWSH